MNTQWKEIESSAAVRVAVIGVLAILALFLFAETISVVQNFGTSANPPTNTITVSGDGKAAAVPDTASISFGATATAADVATAQKKITDIVNAALASVKQSGVTDKDITTSSFNVSPHYTTPSCPPGVFCPNTSSSVSGYDVSETIEVKVHDTTKVATILDGLAKANVSNVNGPNFVVDDPTVIQAQARGQAIDKARQQAQTLAQQLGVHLGKVVSFSDSTNGNPGPQPMFKGAGITAAADSVAPSIPTGQNEYTDSVSITYSIY
ncbi:SIMPL domain-containing protein [Patescibacteria group bacterium]|nr:SIMPL domain-containing protein [Patescibacteria group bacterium]